MEFKVFGRQITLGKASTPAPAPSAPPSKGKQKRPEKSDKLIDKLEKLYGRHKAKAEMDVWIRAEDRARSLYMPRRDSLMYLYEQITKDGYLTGQMKTLKNKVLSEGFAVVDKKTGKELDEVLEKLQRPWFHEFMDRYLDTDFYGHTLLNFDYPEEEGEHAGEFTRFDLIPRENVVPEIGEVLLRPTDGVGVPYRNTEAPYAKLLLEIVLRDETGKYALGILNKAAPEVIWKRYTRTDWSRRSEKFGMPLIGLKTDASEQWELDQKEMALANMGSNGYMLMEENEELEFHESSTNQSGEMYSALKEACNDEIAFLITGQTMTSQDGSSKSQGEVHERVQEHYIQERMRSLSYFINYNLFPFLKQWGYQLDGLEFKWRRLLDEEAAKKKAAEAPPVGGPEGDGPQGNTPADAPNPDTPPAPPKGKPSKGTPPPAKGKQQLSKPNFPEPVAPASATGTLELAAPSLAGLFNEVVVKMHNDRPELKKMLKSKQWQAMFRATAAQLTAAAEEGYGKKLSGLEGGSPDAQLLEKFADNLYIFSANKNYQLLNELNKLLVTKSGSIRPFADFKRQSLTLHDTYNVAWLQTEYNTAVATAQMARKWQSFQQGDISKYFLKYTTVNDDRVRPQHRSLDGIMLPVDHSFWNTHTPPLGWHCRCSLVKVPRSGRTATSENELNNVESAAPGFGHNPAKTGVIFPESHQYNNVPKDMKALLEKIGVEGRMASGYLRAYTSSAGGAVDAHHSHGSKEYDDNLALGKILANRGEKVRLLPNPNEASADATRNGQKWEFKTLSKYTNLEGRVSKELSAGRKQADSLLLYLKGEYDHDKLVAGIHRAVRNDSEAHPINRVAVLRGDELHSINRAQVLSRNFSSLEGLK